MIGPGAGLRTKLLLALVATLLLATGCTTVAKREVFREGGIDECVLITELVRKAAKPQDIMIPGVLEILDDDLTGAVADFLAIEPP